MACHHSHEIWRFDTLSQSQQTRLTQHHYISGAQTFSAKGHSPSFHQQTDVSWNQKDKLQNFYGTNVQPTRWHTNAIIFFYYLNLMWKKTALYVRKVVTERWNFPADSCKFLTETRVLKFQFCPYIFQKWGILGPKFCINKIFRQWENFPTD